MKDQADRVGDRPLEACGIAVPTTSAAEALAQTPYAWIVVADDDGRPVGALTRGALGRLPAETPVGAALTVASPVVLADARTPVDLLLTSPAVRSSNPPAVIVWAGGHVVGVWAEDQLLEHGALEGSRYVGDWSLGGDIAIPIVMRSCRFKHEERDCTAVRSFEEKPSPMPDCSDPEQLGPHPFTW